MKSLVFFALFLMSFGAFAESKSTNDVDNVSDIVINKVLNSVTNSQDLQLLDPTGAGGCYFSSGSVRCTRGGMTASFATSSVHTSSADALLAANDQANGICNGFFTMYVTVQQVPCPAE